MLLPSGWDVIRFRLRCWGVYHILIKSQAGISGGSLNNSDREETCQEQQQ